MRSWAERVKSAHEKCWIFAQSKEFVLCVHETALQQASQRQFLITYLEHQIRNVNQQEQDCSAARNNSQTLV